MKFRLVKKFEDTLLEMAMPRADAIDRIKGYSDTIVGHIIKIVVYGKTLGDGIFKEWKDYEICGYLSVIYNLTIKGHNGKLKESDYFKALTEKQGTTASDYFSTVALFRVNNKKNQKYPDFKLDREYGNEVWSVYMDLLKEVCPMFTKTLKSSNDELDYKDFVPTVDKVLMNHDLF